MSQENYQDLRDVSMADLFRQEIESRSAILIEGLLALERDPSATVQLSELMRAAHSLKGAARIVGCQAAVRVAHAMEDCFVAAQTGKLDIYKYIDTLLGGVDLLGSIVQGTTQSFEEWTAAHHDQIESFLAILRSGSPPPGSSVSSRHRPTEAVADSTNPAAPDTASKENIQESIARPSVAQDRVLRVTAENLNRLLGLAGETFVALRWMRSFRSEMVRRRELNHDLVQSFEKLCDSLREMELNDQLVRRTTELREQLSYSHRTLSNRLADLDAFDRQFANFSTRLYQEVVDCRMRPFADGVQGLPRFVRDLGRSLGKSVKLEVIGEATSVDRDILELTKAPIDHLLRNALDHGIETPAERIRAGKPEEATIRLESVHSAGRLLITVSDDGGGIDVGFIRKAIVERKLTTAETARRMNDQELLEFLFLPGFTLKDSVSEVSGRGVGLDVVQTTARKVGGRVRVFTEYGKGTRFELELPLTLSVIRTLVVEIAGEPYAFPLSRIDTTLKLPVDCIHSVEGRQHFSLNGKQVGIVPASEILELGSAMYSGDLSIVVFGNENGRYGLMVDAFIGEQELVVRPLDSRLGKVKNISAAGLMPDNSPLLIVDVEDLIQEIGKFVSGHRLAPISETGAGVAAKERKRVLVVDDSLTVRELERKLLDSRGYAVDIAVDGMDGWNAVRTGHYDLILTDIDMPRMDGVELVSLIRKDGRLHSLPVMIVSYKDRPEDRQRGLEAGADYYLTKGSFHDETLIRAVVDLIGDTTP